MQTIRTLALSLAASLAMALPVAYFAVVHSADRAVLVTETEINARIVSQVVAANPDYWSFEVQRIEELLARRPSDGTSEIRRVVKPDGTLVAERGDVINPPYFKQARPLYDAGREVARLEITRSLAPVLARTAMIALVGLVAGALGFWFLVAGPLRALERANEALVAERLTAFELRVAKEGAEAASAAKAQFLANMSHEIRTPMNGVLGMTELLLDTTLDDTQRRFAMTIHDSGEALLAIINDILDYSKIEAGRMELENAPFDFRELIAGVIDVLAGRAHAKGIDLRIEVDPDVPEVIVGDVGRLRQILLNLVGNGIKFTENGSVVLAARGVMDEQAGKPMLAFDVRDTGIGMSSSVRERLFSPFTQADASTTRRYGGTGLGLAISKQLVGLMHGSIGVESEPEAGSTFWFRIPLIAGPTLAPSGERGVLEGRYVLIVEDRPANAEIIEHYVSRWGLRSEVVGDAEQALSALARADARGVTFDVVLIDMKMPGMDGFTLAETIGRERGDRSPRLILMSSLLHDRDSDRMKAAGISARLIKPIRRSELLSALLRAESKGATAPPPDVLAAASTASEPDRLKGVRVLLVEDNEVNQRLARLQLVDFGCIVEIARDGVEALDAISMRVFDLVLMDCQMPRMDGFEATRLIRERETDGRIPIIALTANALAGDRDRCLAAGMDDHLAKPFRKAQLRTTLERWTGDRERTEAVATQALA